MSSFRSFPPCPWSERVSAWIDGELSAGQEQLVSKHADSCRTCSALSRADREFGDPAAARPRGSPVPTILQTRHTRVARTAMAIAGVLIMVGSAPDFVRGNTDGDALHDLRHLAIWQAAVGVTVVSAAVTFRLSRLVAVMLVTFLGLTLVAAGYDLVTGHRGPWTDPTHMMEVVAGVLLLRVAWPYVRPGGSGRLSARRTADNRA